MNISSTSFAAPKRPVISAEADKALRETSATEPDAGLSRKPDVSKIFGRIQYVDSFADYRVKVVNAFPDLRVQKVSAFPSSPGRWQEVNSFPEYRIQIVDSFADFTIQYVSAFPGPTAALTEMALKEFLEKQPTAQEIAAR